jgi:hypothetical protein
LDGAILGSVEGEQGVRLLVHRKVSLIEWYVADVKERKKGRECEVPP